MGRSGRWWWIALAVAASACGPGSVGPVGESIARRGPTTAGWRRSLARLADLRGATPAGARTLRIALRLREQRTGRVLEARGAVALSPPDAMRMVLLGPGGTTAVDLWARGDQFRLAVPAADILTRGDARTAKARRHLPVDFLRWWLLAPAAGTLLWHERDADGEDRFVLRHAGGAIVRLDARPDGRVRARRSSGAGSPEERVEADRLGCSPARYESDAGIEVTVRCEGIEPRPPRPEAFVDPDAKREKVP